jgi:hypothetical protein
VVLPRKPLAITAVIAVLGYLAVAGLLTLAGPYAAVKVLAGRPGMPDERPGISPAAISFFLTRIGDSGRAAYQRAEWLDFILPALFVFAGASIVLWARAHAPRVAASSSLVVRLLVALAATEVIENLLLLAAVQSHPGVPPLGPLVGIVVGLKLFFFGVSVVALVGLTVAALMNAAPPGKGYS